MAIYYKIKIKNQASFFFFMTIYRLTRHRSHLMNHKSEQNLNLSSKKKCISLLAGS